MFINKKMREEVINNINLASTLLKYSSLFKDLYNDKNLEYYNIIDKNDTLKKMVKSIKNEDILDMIYRSPSIGIRNKTFKEILTNIIDNYIFSENSNIFNDIDFLLESNFSNDYVKVKILCNHNNKIYQFIVQHDEKECVINITQTNIYVYFNIWAPSYIDNMDKFKIIELNDSLQITDKELFKKVTYNNLLLSLTYTYNINNGYTRPKIDIKDEKTIKARDFNILDDLIYDLQIHSNKFNDIIYKYTIAEANKAVNRIFSNRKEKEYLIHNFNKMVPYNDTKQFKDFLIRNLNAYKYDEENSYKNCIIQINNIVYCIDICNEDYGYGVYSAKIIALQVRDNNFIKNFDEYIKNLLNNYRVFTQQYNVTVAFKEFLSMNNYVHYDEYTSRVFYENYEKEVNEWSEKIFNLDDGNLFWVDDFSKDEKMYDEEELIKLMSKVKEEDNNEEK